MSDEMPNVMIKRLLEAYASAKDISLSEHSDNIIKAVLRKNGNCPCRLDETPCPCSSHLEEVEKDGKCHCNLFVKK